MKAILFDADGVIQSVPESRNKKLIELVSQKDVKPFFDELWVKEEPCLEGREDFSLIVEALVKEKNLSISVAEFFDLWTSIVPNKEVFALIDRLKQNYQVCLATNQEERRASHMRHDLGYEDIFHHSFYSYELEAAKPKAEYFAKAIAKLGHSADELVFIDDRIENVESAKEVGLVGVHFHLDEGLKSLQDKLSASGIVL